MRPEQLRWPLAMSRVGKKVWVRDPALADTDVFCKGTVISEDATTVRKLEDDFAFTCSTALPQGCSPLSPPALCLAAASVDRARTSA